MVVNVMVTETLTLSILIWYMDFLLFLSVLIIFELEV